MNKKAQAALQIGVILTVFIAVIVGVILFQAVAQQAGEGTNTLTLSNVTFTSAANGESVYLDYRAISDAVITNASGGEVVAAGNYTITNNAIDPSDSTLSVQVQTDDAEYASASLNISGTAQPQTYIADSGARSVAGLIAIFFALAVAIIALVPTLRSGVLNMISR